MSPTQPFYDLRSTLAALRTVVRGDCSGSCGNRLGAGMGCLFGVTVMKYWFINGLLDFSTALVLGTVTSPGGLLVRLAAYVLVVPFFLLLRLTYLLSRPRYRAALDEGRCPNDGLLSLDWFTVGILATGLPLALRDLGPWLGMNAVFLTGLFLVPRFVDSDRAATRVKLGSLGAGSLLFLYANYGGPVAAMTPVPAPEAVLGPVATLRLPEGLATTLFEAFNSLLVGPLAVAGFALLMNHLLTHPVLHDVPYVRHTLPRRDPAAGVAVSAVLGTAFYLGVVAVATGSVMLAP